MTGVDFCHPISEEVQIVGVPKVTVTGRFFCSGSVEAWVDFLVRFILGVLRTVYIRDGNNIPIGMNCPIH